MRYFSSTASEGTLAAGIDGSATAMTVSGATGYPTSTPFTVVLDPDTSSEEIVSVTARVGSNWTILRAQDGTVAVPHSTGARFRHMMTARDLREPQEHIDATTGVHGVGSGEGNVVGTSKSQTLTNKTISGTSNTLTNIPQSSVTNLTTDLGELDNRLDIHVAASTGVHGVTTGNIVGASQTQTLTNKTIHRGSNTITVHHDDTEDRYFLSMAGVASSIPGSTVTRFSWTALDSRGPWSSDGHSSRQIVPKSGLYRVEYTTGWAGSEAPGLWVRNLVYNSLADGASIGVRVARTITPRFAEDFDCHASVVMNINAGRAITLFVEHNATTWLLNGGQDNTRVFIEYLGPAS